MTFWTSSTIFLITVFSLPLFILGTVSAVFNRWPAVAVVHCHPLWVFFFFFRFSRVDFSFLRQSQGLEHVQLSLVTPGVSLIFFCRWCSSVHFVRMWPTWLLGFLRVPVARQEPSPQKQWKIECLRFKAACVCVCVQTYNSLQLLHR